MDIVIKCDFNSKGLCGLNNVKIYSALYNEPIRMKTNFYADVSPELSSLHLHSPFTRVSRVRKESIPITANTCFRWSSKLAGSEQKSLCSVLFHILNILIHPPNNT